MAIKIFIQLKKCKIPEKLNKCDKISIVVGKMIKCEVYVMKKVLILLVSMIFFLVACTNDDPSEATVTPDVDTPEEQTEPMENIEGLRVGFDVIFPSAASEDERNALWIEDLIQFKEAVMEKHGKFADDAVVHLQRDLFEDDGASRDGVWIELERNEVLRQNFIRLMEDLIEDVPNRTDVQIAYGMQEAAAALRDGHFLVVNTDIIETILPIEFMNFYVDGVDGMYVSHATEPFSHLLNQRINTINGISMEEIEERLGDIRPVENAYGLRNVRRIRLQMVNVLEYIGLLNDGNVTIAFENEEVTFTPDDFLTFFDDVEFVDGRDAVVPPTFVERAGNRFYYLEETGIVHIIIEAFMLFTEEQVADVFYDERGGEGDYDEIRNEVILAIRNGELVQQGLIIPQLFVIDGDEFEFFDHEVNRDLMNVLANEEVRAIVVDVRGNGGGDMYPFQVLFDTLKEQTLNGMPLYFFIDNASFSAGHVSPLGMRHHGAMIVGEPTGQNAIFYGVMNEEFFDEEGDLESVIDPMITLNNSGMMIQIPNVVAHMGSDSNVPFIGGEAVYASFLEQNPDWEFETLRPDVLIPLTLQDWINNNDPLLRYVIEAVAE